MGRLGEMEASDTSVPLPVVIVTEIKRYKESNGITQQPRCVELPGSHSAGNVGAGGG